jgi:hypothetical protein
MLNDLIYYDLKVAALIAVFYLFYMLLLARETTHTMNRFVLLLGIGLSAVLPLCVITLHKAPSPALLTERGEWQLLPSDAPVEEPYTPLSLAEGTGVRLEGLLAAILLAGFIIRLIYFAKGIWKLNRMIRSGERHTLPSGARVCVVDAPIAPFSWMQTIVLSRADWLSQSTPILAHEEAHVRHRHSYDVVVVELLTALQWFNPVVWFLRQELRTLHEYEADASVLSCGFDESQYIHLLMQKATGIQACALANGIGTQKTKKRILMMLKKKSRRTAWLKALYVVPIALASLAMTAKTVVDYEMNEPESTTAVRVFTDQKRGDAYQIRHLPGVRFFRNDVEEQIPEGRSIALEAKKTTLQVNGTPVEGTTLRDLPTGELKEIRLTEVGPDKFVCNMVIETPKGRTVVIVDGKEATEATVNSLRQEDIDNVSVIGTRETIKHVFNVDADNAVIVQTKKEGDEMIFDLVEQMPQFPGGDAKLMEFIAKNIKYPAVAEEWGVQGRIIVKFIVEKDGSLSHVMEVKKKATAEASDITVVAMQKNTTEQERKNEEAEAQGLKAAQQALADEAIRVVNAMPKWTPGKRKGKAVRCRFTIPVTYRLQ